jgi:hypothetical protein
MGSDYLITTYIYDLTETMALSFTISQYRKDGGLCDADSPDEIIVLKRVEVPKKPKVKKSISMKEIEAICRKSFHFYKNNEFSDDELEEEFEKCLKEWLKVQ